MFCQLGGMIRRMAWYKSMPLVTSSSSMLSIDDESEPVKFTTGAISSMLGIARERNLLMRATAQLRLPWMVLISPLCASMRNGCAIGHFGKVLVEKR